MAISFPCSDCRTIITVGDLLAGERTSCPQCGAFVLVPSQAAPGGHIAAGTPPVPPSPPDEAQHIAAGPPAWDRTDIGLRERDDPFLGIDLLIPASAWNLTRIGLSLMYWGIVGVFLAILAWIAIVLFVFVLAAERRDIFGFNRLAESQFLELAMFFVLGAIVAGFVIVIIGQCMCCTAPPQSGARGQAIGSIVCLLLSIAVAALSMCLLIGLVREGFAFGPALLRGEERAGRMLFILSFLLAGVLYITSHVLFVLFLRAIGRHFRNDLLVFTTGSYLTMYFIFLGINLAANCAQAAVRDPNIGMIFGCLGLIVFVLGVVVLVWYLRLLAAAKDTIVDALRRMER